MTWWEVLLAVMALLAAYGLSHDVERWWDERQWQRDQRRLARVWGPHVRRRQGLARVAHPQDLDRVPVAHAHGRLPRVAAQHHPQRSVHADEDVVDRLIGIAPRLG